LKAGNGKSSYPYYIVQATRTHWDVGFEFILFISALIEAKRKPPWNAATHCNGKTQLFIARGWNVIG